MDGFMRITSVIGKLLGHPIKVDSPQWRPPVGRGKSCPNRPPKPTWLPPSDWDAAFIASPAFLSTWQWGKVRYARLEMSDGRCQCCGKDRNDRHEDGSPVKLNVDHIFPRLHYPELCLTVEATQLLCDFCNRAKGNASTRDWRKPRGAV